jgi:hypothetical protein
LFVPRFIDYRRQAVNGSQAKRAKLAPSKATENKQKNEGNDTMQDGTGAAYSLTHSGPASATAPVLASATAAAADVNKKHTEDTTMAESLPTKVGNAKKREREALT